MKKLLALSMAAILLLLCLIGCSVGDKFYYEKFHGVVRFSEECNRLVVYIPNIGDVEIPENEGCCSCFDGHEPNETYSYQLKQGDLVAINFKYEQSWDDDGVRIMETYPAKFDRKAGLIEVKKQNISFYKNDSGYVFSFPTTEEIKNAETGDSLYFIYHEAKNGFDSMRLYATGEITSRLGDVITVALTIHENEADFLENYCSMSVELTWEN